jgi:hypothetical protein
MIVKTINGDAKPERGGKAVLSAASKVHSGIVNVPCVQPATPVWKRPGDLCPARHYMSRHAQRPAVPERKCRTEQVAERIHATSTVEDVGSKRVTKSEFGSNAPALISSNANVHSVQRDAT